MVRKICVSLFLLFAVVAGTAFAHSVLVSSQPEDGATVTKPVSELKLTFNTKIEKVLSLKVIKGKNQKERSPKASSEGKIVKAALQQPLEKGSYQVHYRVIGEDGHAVEGGFSFKVKSSADEPTADEPSTTGKSGDSTTENSSPNQKVDEPKWSLSGENQATAADKASGNSPVIIGIVIVLVVIVIVVLVALLRKRK